MEVIRNRIYSLGLNATATQDLLQQHLQPSATEKCYRKHQLRFLDFAKKNQVSFDKFTAQDVVNFLSTMRTTHHHQTSTLKTTRAAITHLHQDPNIIKHSNLLNSYIDSLVRQDPPTLIHRPTLDLSPALAFAQEIASRGSTTVYRLQIKLAFLLSMAAFLRPSDLERIPFGSCSVDRSTGALTFSVVAPKEKRKGRRIIKPYTIHPHRDNPELCPVQCFLAIRDHPHLTGRSRDTALFINSKNFKTPICASTLSSWLHHHFISLVTSEKGVSIRSLASSRALDQGVAMQDILSLGNWASSDTFQNHYQRNQMARIDFTTTVLSSGTSLDTTSPTDDEYFDAENSFGMALD